MPVITAEDIGHMQDEIYEVYMNKSIYKYIVDLVTATRNSPYIERAQVRVRLLRLSRCQKRGHGLMDVIMLYHRM